MYRNGRKKNFEKGTHGNFISNIFGWSQQLKHQDN